MNMKIRRNNKFIIKFNWKTNCHQIGHNDCYISFLNAIRFLSKMCIKQGNFSFISVFRYTHFSWHSKIHIFLIIIPTCHFLSNIILQGTAFSMYALRQFILIRAKRKHLLRGAWWRQVSPLRKLEDVLRIMEAKLIAV